MRKLTALLLCVALTLPLMACGNSRTNGRNSEHETDDLKIALCVDASGINDQNFDEIIYKATKAWTRENDVDFDYFELESDSLVERETVIDRAVAEKYTTVITVGEEYKQALVNSIDDYPMVHFIAFDVGQEDLDDASGVEGYSRENLSTIVFKEEYSGFIAGYSAVKMGYRKLGFLGGMAMNAVKRYGYGYVQGADTAAKELGLTDVELRYAYADQWYGDLDITAAMQTWYVKGTEVIFAAAGLAWNSVGQAAYTQHGKMIGVDIDQKENVEAGYGKGIYVTSAMKDLNQATISLLDDLQGGHWADYQGRALELGMSEDGTSYVGLPVESTVWTDSYTEEDYEQLLQDLHSGKIQVNEDVSAAQPSAEVIDVIYQGNIK